MVQVIVWHQVDIKLLSEPMLTFWQLDPQENVWWHWNQRQFCLMKYFWKDHLQMFILSRFRCVGSAIMEYSIIAGWVNIIITEDWIADIFVSNTLKLIITFKFWVNFETKVCMISIYQIMISMYKAVWPQIWDWGNWVFYPEAIAWVVLLASLLG